jgi:hypothetical protein
MRTAHRNDASDQRSRIVGAAFKQRTSDLLPLTGIQRLQHDSQAQRGSYFSQGCPALG